MRFVYNLVGNWTNNARFRASPTSVNRQCVGFYSANCSPPGGLLIPGGALQPKWSWSQRTTFGIGEIDLSLLWRHIDAMSYEPGLPALLNGTITNGNAAASPLAGRTANFNRIPAYDYFDISARFSITKELQLTLSAFNIFNRAPPVVGSGAGTTSQNSGNTFPLSYDPLGRRYSASLSLRF